MRKTWMGLVAVALMAMPAPAEEPWWDLDGRELRDYFRRIETRTQEVRAILPELDARMRDPEQVGRFAAGASRLRHVPEEMKRAWGETYRQAYVPDEAAVEALDAANLRRHAAGPLQQLHPDAAADLVVAWHRIHPDWRGADPETIGRLLRVVTDARREAARPFLDALRPETEARGNWLEIRQLGVGYSMVHERETGRDLIYRAADLLFSDPEAMAAARMDRVADLVVVLYGGGPDDEAVDIPRRTAWAEGLARMVRNGWWMANRENDVFFVLRALGHPAYRKTLLGAIEAEDRSPVMAGVVLTAAVFARAGSLDEWQAAMTSAMEGAPLEMLADWVWAETCGRLAVAGQIRDEDLPLNLGEDAATFRRRVEDLALVRKVHADAPIPPPAELRAEAGRLGLGGDRDILRAIDATAP